MHRHTAFTRRISSLQTIMLLFIFIANFSIADVQLNIEARNPRPTPQSVNIESILPKGIGPDDILSTDGLSIGYDINKETYYVHGIITLARSESRQFNIRLRDIWVITETEINTLRPHVRSLLTRLGRSDSNRIQVGAAKDILTTLDEILESQRANNAATADMPAHIETYARNMDALTQAKRTLLDIENAAIAEGHTMDQLLGETDRALSGKLADTPVDRKVIIRISVNNPSPHHTRLVEVRHDLPREIAARDIVDADGLQIKLHTGSNRLFLHAYNVALEPGAAKTFNVTVRDRWDVNSPRIDRFRTIATLALAEAVKSNRDLVSDKLRTVLASMKILRETPAPQVVNEHYVAFFREQARKVAELERALARIQVLPMQAFSPGTNTPPPDYRTTWLIIYTILGFLALLSAPMYFRYLYISAPDHQAVR